MSSKTSKNSSLLPNEQLRSFGKTVQKKVNESIKSVAVNQRARHYDVEDNVNYVLGYN